jgi:hypothetical protein
MSFVFIRRLASILLLWCASCRSQDAPTDDTTGARPSAETSAARSGGESPAPSAATYPVARWRLASSSELSQTHLWLSHILIRHRHVPAHWVSFNSLDWAAAPDPPDRSREQALELAEEVAQLAQATPSTFSELAARHSEDVTTRDEGGSLGGIGAGPLRRWPQVLDAAAALGAGEVSRPVETPYGFHVLLRRAPPAEGTFSGSRLVIAYDEAPWLHQFLARGAIPSRSRAEALALAQAVYEKAARNPDAFEQLVQLHSEHRDALRGGDFGEWSTHQHTPFAQAVEKLTQLEVGEVSSPIDSPFGFQIIRRTAPRPRVIYAAEVIQLTYEPDQPPEASSSEAAVLRRLQGIAGELRREPGRFEVYQRELCCTGTETWQEGQGSVLQEQVLARLQVGGIASAPTRLEGNRYALLRRVAPGAWSPEPVRFDLPAPERPSLAEFVAHAPASQIAALGQTTARDLALDGDDTQRLMAAHDVEQQFAATRSKQGRWRVFSNVRQEVERLLGPQRFADYTAIVDRFVEHELLHGMRTSPRRMAVPQLAR